MTIFSSVASAFNQKKGLKVITGLNNFNLKQIKKMAQATEIAGATYLDIAANTDIVKELQCSTKITLCVSSVTPNHLAKCNKAGVEIIEIGNYDCFYEQDRLFNIHEITEISKRTKDLVPDTTLCVTVPHVLELYQQIQLASSLQNIGIDIIQTEGKRFLFSRQNELSSAIQKSASTFSSTYSLSSRLQIPLISASGISALTSPISFLYGASCVGIGTNIKRLQNIASMVIYINEINTAIACNNNKSHKIQHSIKFSKVTRKLILH